MSISKLIDQYFESLKGSGKSEKTIDNCKVSLKDFNSHFGNYESSRITKTHLKRYITLLKTKPVKNQNQYVFGKLRNLRYFVVFCESNKLTLSLSSQEILQEETRLSSIVLKDQMTYSGPYLKPDEIDKIIKYWDYAKVETPLLSLRNKTIISLLYSEALQPSDLVELRRGDYKNGTIKLPSGTLKMSTQSKTYLNSYIARRTDDAEELFVGYWSYDPEIMRTHPITISTVRHITKIAANESGFRETISPQILRNSAMIEDLLKTTYNYESFTKKFRLSEFNTTYTRFLPKVKELLNIPKEAVTAEEYAKQNKLSVAKLIDLIKRNEVPAVKFHHFYLVSPISKEGLRKLKKRKYTSH